METTEEKPKRRPFHETIVDAINWAFTHSEMAGLADLIKATSIPKNHDEIIAAWEKRKSEMRSMQQEDFGVPADLFEQKQEAKEKEAKKQAAAVVS